MSERRGGCGLVVLGFVLGWGFSQLTQPTYRAPATSAPVVYERPAASADAPPTASATPPQPVTNPEPRAEPPVADSSLVVNPVQEIGTRDIASAPTIEREVTDASIRNLMIEQSLSTYPGSCPCPYNTDRAGGRCEERSAYSRPGGAAPLCYPEDIADADVEHFREGLN